MSENDAQIDEQIAPSIEPDKSEIGAPEINPVLLRLDIACRRAILDSTPADSTVLELNCGGGSLGSELEKKGCRVWAVDVAWASRTLHHERLDFDRQDHKSKFVGLPEPGTVFDVLVADRLLERTIDPAGMLSDALAYLGPGGLAMISFGNIAHYQVRRSLLRGVFDQHPISPDALWPFTLESAENILENGGLVIEGQTVLPIAPGGFWTRLALRRRPRLFAARTLYHCRLPEIDPDPDQQQATAEASE